MKKLNVKMKCPSCGNEIKVDELLVSQFHDSIKSDLEKELSNRKSELNELSKQLGKEKKDLDQLIKEKVKSQLSVSEKEMKERIEQKVRDENVLRMREKETIIADLRVKIDEAKRKADQGSVQLQGEVQEQEILQQLKEFHVYDLISQSKKGANAADILQIVRTQNGNECGKIYYESKRTKSWSNDWVKKFKQDNVNAKADILVLVTNTLPKDIKRYGIIDGVWICSFNDVKELSLVLRYGLLKLQAVAISQEGKGTKMEALYKYLTSEDFKNVFSTIMDGFRNLQDSHSSEKIKLQRVWKEREKVLEQILLNSVEFYGSIKGIAGVAIPEIKMLESVQDSAPSSPRVD
jgi:hypothetical protein